MTAETTPTPYFALSHRFLWLSLALFVVLVISFFLPAVPNDYWWYVRMGQDIVRERSIPALETFSYTRAGQPVAYHSWLSALLLGGIYQVGALPLTFWLRGLALSLAYAITGHLTRQAGAGPKLATLLIVLAALSGAANWTFRPQLLVYPLFVWVTWILLRWQNGKDKHLWGLALACLLWVNLHGSFVLPFFLIGAALLAGKGKRRPLLIWTALALALTLVNPRGWGVWSYMLDTLSNPSHQVYSVEWGPPVNNNWHMKIFFAWLLALPVLAGLSKRKLSLIDWLWFGLFGWLALSGLRYVIWFLFLLPIFTARLAADWDLRWLDPSNPRTANWFNFTLGGFLLVSAAFSAPGLRETWWLSAPVSLYTDTPVEAVTWLKARPNLPGQLWADLNFSSYLIYALPERPVWIDTRFNYPTSQWEEYIAIIDAAPEWQIILQRDGVNLLLLYPGAEPALLKAVEAAQNWCEQYRDPSAVIFARCEKP